MYHTYSCKRIYHIWRTHVPKTEVSYDLGNSSFENFDCSWIIIRNSESEYVFWIFKLMWFYHSFHSEWGIYVATLVSQSQTCKLGNLQLVCDIILTYFKFIDSFLFSRIFKTWPYYIFSREIIMSNTTRDGIWAGKNSFVVVLNMK